jgi:hypothetical protein
MESTVLAKMQGPYFAATGLWPLCHMRSFLAVTGPKTDLWLVQTVGALVTCIGGQLLLAAKDKSEADNLRPLAAGSAASLALIDVLHVARRRISPIYLLDAAAEIGLVYLWGRNRGRSVQPR